MTLALGARFRFDPRSILEDPWRHDMAHVMVSARLQALADAGLPPVAR